MTYPWEGVSAGVPCWHIHHDKLLEWSERPLSVRAEFICMHKQKSEVEIRLRLMRPVKGKLPEAVTKAWGAYEKARDAHSKTLKARNEVRDTHDKMGWNIYGKVLDAYNKAGEVRHMAGDAHDKAVVVHYTEIEALHAKECPDCPWDGKTIFPEETEEA